MWLACVVGIVVLFAAAALAPMWVGIPLAFVVLAFAIPGAGIAWARLRHGDRGPR